MRNNDSICVICALITFVSSDLLWLRMHFSVWFAKICTLSYKYQKDFLHGKYQECLEILTPNPSFTKRGAAEWQPIPTLNVSRIRFHRRQVLCIVVSLGQPPTLLRFMSASHAHNSRCQRSKAFLP